MSHVGALTPVMANIYLGITTVILKTFDAKQAWELIRDEKITSTLMVPAMLQFMQATHDKAAHDCSTLRWCMSGAAPVPVTLIQAHTAMGIEVPQVYGLTESCGPGCMILGEDAVKRVVDAKGQECASGESGEVLLRGRHNMVGYWNRPDDTAQTLRGCIA
jgi:acyl-CoA synthetase (AMP-forming)/AMP-acid ligase II